MIPIVIGEIVVLFGLFRSCDKMVGGSFEKSLADLKSITEI